MKDTDKVYFEAEFKEKIKADESYWTCEDQNSVILFITKLPEVIWSAAFKGHKEIDTKKVDNSKRIDEFDNETQSALNKIVYEQNRKKNGLPTTEEDTKLKQLEKAWNQPDSPFYGQPFDPSQFQLNEPIYHNTPDYENKMKWEKEQQKKSELQKLQEKKK
jgi:hypothetical protein